MNSQLNSQPMNWAIDYSQNKAGQIYGNAISNIGGMTGNAIMEFAKKQREDAEKKAKEEAAQKFLTAQGMPEEDAKGVVKGIDFTGSPRQNPTVWGTKQADEPPAEQIGGAVSVKTKAEYDALPVGTSYIGPDGKRATKKAR